MRDVARTQPSQRDVAELSEQDLLELLETVLGPDESTQVPEVVPDRIVKDVPRIRDVEVAHVARGASGSQAQGEYPACGRAGKEKDLAQETGASGFDAVQQCGREDAADAAAVDREDANR